VLLDAADGFHVLGMFPNCAEVSQQMDELNPDVVLMDIQMPDVDGIQGVKIIGKLHPHIKVIMQTVFEDDEKIFEALRYGASGYILKKTEPQRIIEAIKEVINGGSPMTPSIATRVLGYFRNHNDTISNEMYGLSEREKDILLRLVEGNSYKMIAEQISLSYHTVNSHIKKIYRKLHVNSLGEAVSKAIHKKIV